MLAVSAGLTVVEIELEVAGFPDTQVKDDVKATVTKSLLARVVLVNVGLFVPRFDPLTFHW
jgi:hypothetical protein